MGCYNKRKIIYEQLRDCRADIVLLQESHNTTDTEHLWRNEWGSAWYNSNGTSNARGVSILLSRNMERSIKIISEYKDQNGRLLLITCVIEDKQYVICNVYGPNTDDPEFYQSLVNAIHGTEFDNLVIGGDFNFVMNDDLDSRNRKPSHPRSKEILLKLMEQCNITDIWRDRNETARRYTWYKTKPKLTCSRLDWFLVNTELSTSVDSCDIKSVVKTDHRLITITIRLDDYVRGPGTWRFNTLHLQDDIFKRNVRQIMLRAIDSASVLNPSEKFEFVKDQAIEYCQTYARNKAKNKNKRRLELDKMLDTLNHDLSSTPSEYIESIREAIVNIESELEHFVQQKVNATIFRARVRYTHDGEKKQQVFL